MSRQVIARTLRRLLAVALAVGAIGVAWQWARSRQDIAATPAPGELVDVGGHRLHIWCVGDGSPTVLFESGLGGGAFDWGYVQPAAARARRACTYDRAGYGYSEPGPRPRSSRQIARELAVLIDRAGIVGPVVLVGHSFGGYNVRVFTADYPNRVAGLVLVDASHEDQGRRYAEAGVPSGDLPGFAPYVLPIAGALGLTRLIGFSPGLSMGAIAPDVQRYVGATRFRTVAAGAAAGEYLALTESGAQVRATRRPVDMPLIVLSRTRQRDAASGRAHEAMQADQATLSTKACLSRVADSGHLIPADQPAAVIAAIDAVVAASRTNRAPVCPAASPS